MKFLFSSLLFLSISLIVGLPNVTAQELSKSETKEIKTELKKFKKNPLLYKVKLQKLHNQIEECDGNVEAEELKTKMKNRQVKILNDSIRLMHMAIDMLVEEMEQMASGTGPDYALEGSAENASVERTSVDVDMPETPEGMAYKVQVGQYRLLNISDYFTSPKIFNYEMVDGKYTYNIGYFDNQEDARRFASDIKKMGIKDAFVTKYKAGVRLSN